MKDLDKRLSGISPEKRELLRKLLEAKGLALPAAKQSEAPPPAESAMVGVLKKVGSERVYEGHDPARYMDKDLIQDVYNSYHEQLRGAIFHEHSFFMNLGYVADGSTEYSPVKLPEGMIGRNYVKLVLETISDCDLTGKRVLDVGCGRGGTINTIRTYFRAAETVGIDLAQGAIAFCKARHEFPDTSFLRGDAEQIPFADGSFDVVTNIESSHHYGRIQSFYSGVYRVLVDGGYFLCATMLSPQQFERDRGWLRDMGFALERDVDVTRNVLAACDQDRRGILGGFASASENAWIANAVSLPGSETYNMMASGAAQYRALKLRKRAAAA